VKIVILEGHASNPGDLSYEPLKALGDVTIYDRTPKHKVIEYSKDAEILLINKTVLGKEELEKLPKLKYIGVLATGYNVVDLDAAKNLGIIVTNIPNYSTKSVAQMTFALLLELCNHVQEHSEAVKNGDWANSKDFCFWNHPLMELDGKTLGIIGFGSIGKKVSEIATALGMKVIANSRTITDETDRKNFKWVSLDELFREADVVSLHCPLFPETKGIINKENLSKMKSSAFLINTSRGPLIVEEDLAYALNNNIIAGAALDVLSAEPPAINNPLFTSQNCIITPHIAWATKEARQRLLNIAVENIKAFVKGEVVNVVKAVNER
jgi:glycerate dehydrogenase